MSVIRDLRAVVRPSSRVSLRKDTSTSYDTCHRSADATSLSSGVREPGRARRLLAASTAPLRSKTTRPAVSQHLARLRLAGLVSTRKEGRRVIYSLRDGHLRRVVAEALNLADHRRNVGVARAGSVPRGVLELLREMTKIFKSAHLDFALAEVLPEAAKLAEAADVFLERGAFDASQARRYLSAAANAGLVLRLHGDQFTEQGAVPLAIELGARSVDHLEATGPDGIAQLAASDVTGVLLPTAALFLDRPMPPARALVDAGAFVALATDFNPGSSFTESLPLVCSLAATQLHLSPAEALVATTVNAAHVLGRADRKGRIAPGYDADLTLVDAPDWRYLAYHLGHDHVAAVVLGGERAELG